MKYIFIPKEHGDHIRVADGARGDLSSFPDTAVVHSPHPVLSDSAGYTPVESQEPAQEVPVPESLANWRVKAVLDLQGLTATVDAAIASMPDGPEKIVISRAWNGNGDVLRHSPTVAAFTATLGLTDAQADDMFRLAATFNP
jgi:hypothetical protein